VTFFLRRHQSGLYLGRDGDWTQDRTGAYQFEDSGAATEVAGYLSWPDLELIMAGKEGQLIGGIRIQSLRSTASRLEDEAACVFRAAR